MVNPGAFSGSRKAFLMGLKDYYAAAVDDGNAAEAISTIQRRYLIRYPVEIPHDVEPSDEHLAAVDDDAAVPDPEGPNPDLMGLEEYEAALVEWENRQKLLLFRKAQIKRWFAYQYMKDMDLDSTQTGAFNPYRVLLSKLTGKKINVPRQRSAVNTWRKTQRQPLEAEVQRRLKERDEQGEEKMKKQDMVAFRDLVARETFQLLTEEEQAAWAQTAVHEQKEAMREWKKEMETKTATDPKSRQIAIQGLIKFMQPILDLVCEATGWKASFICGGPEPAQGGLLNVLSIHSGATSGDIKMSFGRAERVQFRKTMVPIYGSFLQKCYTPVECRSRALAKEAGFVPMSDLDLENEGAAIDPVSSSTQPPPIRLGSFPLPITQGSIQAGMFPRAASTPASLPTTVPGRALKNGPAATPTAATTTPPSVATNPPTTAPATGPTTASMTAVSAAPAPPTAAAPTAAPTPATSVEPTPPTAAPPTALFTTEPMTPFAAPQTAVSATKPTTTPVAQSHATREINEVDEGANERDRDDLDEAMGDNPFPFDVRGESSPPLGVRGLGRVSRNPTPLPSPCASPQPSARPSPAPHPSPPAPSATVSEPTRRSPRGAKGRIDGGEEQMEGRMKNRSKRTLEDSQEATSSSGPAAKRTRTSTVGPAHPQVGFTVPNDAPKWFKNAFDMLSSLDGGKEWATVLGYWGRFEVQAGYKEIGKLGTADRPTVISGWIKRARSTTWRPNIDDPVAFGSEVKSWWVGLQPKWRCGERGTLLKRSEGDWEELKRPGPNGLLSVAAALFFWGGALDNRRKNRDWLEAVEDFQLALSKVIDIAID